MSEAIGELLAKLPTFDPSWATGIQDRWVACFQAACRACGLAAKTPSNDVWTEERVREAAEKFVKEHVDREDFQGLYPATFISFARELGVIPKEPT